MNKRPAFRFTLSRRFGAAIFAVMIVVYLVGITYSYSGRLDSTRHVVQLAILWCLGILALILLVRLWRHAGMYDKFPHVCFKAEFPSASSAREEMSRILESHLCVQFGAVERGVLLRWGPRIVNLQVEQKPMSVIWHPNRFNREEWILTVVPDLSSLWDEFRRRKSELCTEQLKLVCRDIHGLLASVTGISDMRWYFDGFPRQGSEAVWTPDELPWAET
jgi:hypothetical protein